MTRWLAALLLFAAPMAQAETIAIVNARLLTVGPLGEIERGTVVVRDQVKGKNVTLSAGMKYVARKKKKK